MHLLSFAIFFGSSLELDQNGDADLLFIIFFYIYLCFSLLQIPFLTYPPLIIDVDVI